MLGISILTIALAVAVLFAIVMTVIVLNLRRVVPTNEVHTIQTGKATTSYGKGMEAGNTYYEWPSWIPIIGLTKVVLPVSVFDLNLTGYEAYDKERVPFVVDITAFFRINDSNTAAQRVANFQELHNQLTSVLQGAVRTVLASHEIDSIMLERSKFGEQFTSEVVEQLKSWGVETVKNIELMDIRDSKDSHVIHNIMSKRTSAIEMESRTVVAANKRKAEIAEIEAERDIDMQAQEAEQQVGQRTAEKDRLVGIANEQAHQEIKEQQKTTATKEMAVVEVKSMRQAEITKGVRTVEAEQEKAVTLINAEAEKNRAVIQAEGQKTQTTLIAEGNLEAKKRESEGITAEGTARADAETKMQLAPVTASITLAKEIGGNEGYQKYLVTIRQVEAAQAVGIAQSGALEKANVRVIANAGAPAEGLSSVMDLFSSKGGSALGSMLEAVTQSDVGKALVEVGTGVKAAKGSDASSKGSTTTK